MRRLGGGRQKEKKRRSQGGFGIQVCGREKCGAINKAVIAKRGIGVFRKDMEKYKGFFVYIFTYCIYVFKDEGPWIL